jgi:hypothetical protein
MPLITSNTDLKSLSFGHDRPGGGSSGQPFLFTGFNIPNVDFPPPNTTLEQAYSGSAGFGIGQNLFDIPPLTLLVGKNVREVTLFKGNGIDIATPIINGLDKAAKFITNGAEGAVNAVIGAINNSFDTTQNPSSPDFLWRKNRFNIAHSFADTVRVTKFLTTPSGIFFIIKQELLERQNVKVDGYTRLYNPGSTIAQVGVNSIGYHLNKAGINPFERSYFKGGNIGYFDNARLYKNRFGLPNQPDDIGRGSNRLTLLTLSKINQENTLQVALATNNQYGVTPPGSVDLLKYGGGPGSILGIGNTNIRWQNPTRTVLLRRDKTGFSKVTNESNYNYLTPIGSPNIVWYYNPNASTTTINGVAKKISVYQSLYLSLPETDRDKLFNLYFNGGINYRNNTYTISSSLYSPPSLLSESSTIISRKGTDPTKPEYYTPDSNSTTWVYTAANGAAKKYFDVAKEEINTTNTSSLFDSIFIGGLPGESKNTNSTNIFSNKKNNTDKDLFTLDGVQIANKTSLGKAQNTEFGTSGIVDFRSGSFVDQNGKSLVSSTDYTVFNRNTYGSKTSFKGNYSGGSRITDPNAGISSDSSSNDFITLQFTVTSPQTTIAVNFKAYLENWSDGFKGDWSSIKYMGRAESFYKYNGFSRDSSISFLVPTLSRLDLKNNYSNLNQLISSVAPSYSTGTGGATVGLMRGVITYVTMGDYFKNMPSIVNNVNYEQINDMGWDINRNQDGTKITDSLQLPKGIKVNISFTPLHNFVPQYNEKYIG